MGKEWGEFGEEERGRRGGAGGGVGGEVGRRSRDALPTALFRKLFFGGGTFWLPPG